MIHFFRVILENGFYASHLDYILKRLLLFNEIYSLLDIGESLQQTDAWSN